MADHPLRSATHRRFGGPLPRQLPNGTRVHLLPDFSFDPSAMRQCGLMRYYRPFRDAIPLQKPGSSRVTHPSATRNTRKQAPQCPSFDLHVLSTPPAFVLSQDQTLVFNPADFFACFLYRSSRSRKVISSELTVVPFPLPFRAAKRVLPLILYRFQDSRALLSQGTR